MRKSQKRKPVLNDKDEAKEKPKPKKLKVERKEMKEEPPEEEEPVQKPRNKKVVKPAPIDGDPKSILLWKRNPGMFKQLRPHDNPNVNLDKITYGSSQILTWCCNTHETCDEHLWKVSVASRTHFNTGCPFCCTIGGNKKDCKCTRPTFLNADGSQKPGYPSKMKRCAHIKCKKEKPVSEFGLCKKSKDGFNGFCLSCCNVETKKFKNLNAVITRLFLQGKKCADCGETNDILLECDHVTDNKAKSENGNKIKNMRSYLTASNLCLELQKTEVVCIMCHRIRTLSRKPLDKSKETATRRSRSELVQKLKLERKGCKNCNKEVMSYDHQLFDWDHIDPKTKRAAISRMMRNGSSLTKIEEEIEKCQLLCCKCHRLKTAKDAEWRTISDFSEEIIIKARKFLDAVFKRDANNNYIHIQPLKVSEEPKMYSFKLIQHK